VSIGAVYSLLTFRRRWVAGLLLAEALVVCFSRLYVFEHFPTDVVAGFALGSAIALAGQAVERRFLVKQGDAFSDLLVRLFRNGPLKL
jgi:membrane-associated phospholipid phosphatase